MADVTSLPLGLGSKGLVSLNLSMANRHGLIAGATGTGKTVTLQLLAEGFSAAGVPVFAADVKGDLSGIAAVGTLSDRLSERLQRLSITDFTPAANPTLFWDLKGAKGHQLRATISEFGPLLLARLLGLNDTQTGVLQICFKVADEQGLLLLDLKDLQAMLSSIAEQASTLQTQYGNVSKASVGSIQRSLLSLSEAGAESFFAEPALRFEHLLQKDFSGRGVISVLDATSVISNPTVYSTFLLWLLSELFENLPEVGDLDKPKLVFFFDEAHLLFSEAPKPLLEKIEQVVRLIRSKGVGIYFITQNPLDVPDTVLGQLGNRVQHALRAFTEKDQKAVKAAAKTFRTNPELDVGEAITSLVVGEALVSVLNTKGMPTPVERVMLYPPHSRIGPVTDSERSEIVSRSPFAEVYRQSVDRQSAYEVLAARQKEALAKAPETPKKSGKEQRSVLESFGDSVMKSATRSIGSYIGRQLVRGILGSLGKGR